MNNSGLPENIFGGKDKLLLETKEIILDGKVVQIGANLEKALRALREIPEVHNEMRIWVDAYVSIKLILKRKPSKSSVWVNIPES